MQTGKAISVPAILKVGKGTLNKIGNYLKTEGLEQIVIFLGNGLIDLFGERVMRSLKEQGITGDYEGIGNLAVGYIDGEVPKAAKRKEGRVFWIE